MTATPTEPTSRKRLCMRCRARYATEVVRAGERIMGQTCMPCLDDVMYQLSLTEPEGVQGYASWRAAAGLPAPKNWPLREPPVEARR